ncbi:MAG: HlyD family efflux transporter periplasmic adaptor subunit [Pseudomonadota bacterium]
MDVLKTKTRASSITPIRGVMALVVAVLAVAGWQLSGPSGAQKMARSGTLLGTVKQGDLKVQVDGYGNLRSDRQKLLTTITSGTVEEILLKPGAQVKADSVILRLSNPELEKLLIDEQQKLLMEQVGLRQMKLNQSLELLAEGAKLEEIRTNHLSAKTTREEQEEWAKKGVVSKLSFRETQLKETLLAKSIEANLARVKQIRLVHAEVLKIQGERIATQEERYAIMKAQHARLNVRAGMDGVLQTLSVELGQSFLPGQKLALIGGTADLVAMIKIPQAAAEQVKPGQLAVIDTRQDKVEGKVLRVNPAVENGTVMVEIAFMKPPPPSARPELNVDATIYTNTLQNVLYVERPANARAHAGSAVFRLDAGSRNAQRTQVGFGAEAGRYIEVKSGLKPRDTVILSDMSKYAQLSEVALVD